MKGCANLQFLGQVLLRMLNAYYNHVRAFENTLVTKYFGLHCVKLNGPAQKKVWSFSYIKEVCFVRG